jgi:carbonic anhydrase/acetyltransferase-like protein (isoleucine patch superfamily)
MSLAVKIRRGEGPVFGRLKSLARRLLSFHVPVAGPTRLLFRSLYLLHVFIRETWIWAARFFWYEPLFRSQCDKIGERFEMEELPYLVGRGRITIGSGVRLSGKSSVTFSNRGQRIQPELWIGDDTFIGHDCALNIAQSIRIGSHCLLASGVRVQDYDGHPLDADQRRAGEPTPPQGIKPVKIGDDVWIGAGAIILKGITIGDRSVVGAQAVVTKDVPSDVVVAGNPARVVKHLADLNADHI